MNSKQKSSGKDEAFEIAPDAWDRFERAVDTVIKSGPKHRPAKERTGVAREPKRTKLKPSE
jgi:hypothetical protein